MEMFTYQRFCNHMFPICASLWVVCTYWILRVSYTGLHNVMMMSWVYIYVASFFSVMGSYGPERHSLSASVALKKLVKELHKNGIEVVLIVHFSMQ